MRVWSSLFPFGVPPFPRAFGVLGYRMKAFLAQTPLFFVVLVVAIALVFRAGIGVVRGAPIEEATSEASQEHKTAPIPLVSADPSTRLGPGASRSVVGEARRNPAPEAAPAGKQDEAARQSAFPPRRKPRTHGRR